MNFQISHNAVSVEKKLISFDKNHIRLLLFLICLFITAILFKLHGYSISAWRDHIDGSVKKEILFGKARHIRSDDWAVEIPMMLAQLSHNPKFPLVNQNIASGLNMMTHSKVPIRHILTFFRPTVWGFFFGADFGLSWMWWSMIIGLFYAYFLVFMIISKNNFFLSSIAGVFLLFSPFFQFWSMHMAEIPIFMALIFVSCCYLCFSLSRKIILLHSLILGWVLSCFAFNFVYPPYQVPCAYLLLIMLIAIVVERYGEYSVSKHIAYRGISLLIALLIFAYAAMAYYVTAKDIIRIMMNTVYPGNRFCTGGDFSIWWLFSNNYLFTLVNANYFRLNFSQLGNVCEISSFLFFFPPIALMLVWQIFANKAVTDKFSVILLGYFVLILLYLFVGFTPEISRYSLFYAVPEHRTLIGLGIANSILLVSFLSKSEKISLNGQIIVSILWVGLLFYSGIQLRKHLPTMSAFYMTIICYVSGLLAYFLVRKDKRFIIAIAMMTFFSSFTFNPIVSGGTSFLYENKLSEKIISIDQTRNGNTKWIAFGSWEISNLFRIIGVKAIDGTHSYPLPDFWTKFDPDHKYFSEYNRYANVTFEPSSEPSIRFHSPIPDMLTVYVNPDSSILQEMGISHIVVNGEYPGVFDDPSKFKKLYSIGNTAIYKHINGDMCKDD